MKKNNLLFFLIGLTLLGASCASPDGNSSSGSAQVDSNDTAVNFELTLNGLFSGSIENKAHQSQVQSLQTDRINFSENSLDLAIINYFSGQIIISNQNDLADIKTYPVTVAVNTETLVINLLQTIVLKPGTFMFELSINRAGQQYAGVVVSDIFDTNGGAINTIDMDLKPIIGDSLITTDIVEDLGNLSFQYSDVPNLKDASDDIIEIGVVIDSTSDEAIFRFDDTGTSEAYLNLFDEPDKIELKLYKNGMQIGKSKIAQETQPFNFGQDINMDLVPLYGRTSIMLSSDGGDATFDIEFPSEVISSGSVTADNLEVYLTFNGLHNGTQSHNINGSSFTLDATNDIYSGGSLSFSGVQYDNLNVYLSYKKIDTDELIGACNFQLNLNSTTQHGALCNISIQNSIIQSGNIMALANISVYSPSLTPGASVYVIKDGGEEQTLGITDGNGYIETYLKSGSYQIGARLPANGRFGETSIVLDPMEVANIAVTLSASAPLNASVLINNGQNATYSKYVTLNLSATDGDSIVAYYASESNIVPNENDPGWLTIVDATSDYQGDHSFQFSDGDGTKTVFVWFKNPSNYISPVAQDSIILQKNAGIYLSNFSITTSAIPDSNDLNQECVNEFGATYRLADWNDIATYIDSSQSNALTFSDYIGLPPEADSYGVDNKRFVSSNGNRYADVSNTRQYYVSRLNMAAEIPDPDNKWFVPYSNLYTPEDQLSINASDDLVLIPETDKTINISKKSAFTVTEIQNLTAVTVCFGETGYHPLLNGTFDDPVNNFEYWGYVSGLVSTVANELVLENDIGVDSIANQENIGVVDGESYRLTADIKTATEDTTVTVQVLDADDDILVSIQTSNNSWTTEFNDFVVDVGAGDVLPLKVQVSIPADSTGNGFADNITLIRQ
jgi:hypothetical protein